MVVSAFHSTPPSRRVREPPHHLVERALAALVDAVGVVHVPRAVDRDADEEVVLAEERRPLRRRSACRSSGSCTRRAGRAAGSAPPARPSGGRSRGPSASAPRPARRSSPPGAGMRLDQLPEVGIEQLIGHPESGCPDRASPWRGRSSRSSRGCRRRPSAWRAGGTPAARGAHRRQARPCVLQRVHLRRDATRVCTRSERPSSESPRMNAAGCLDAAEAGPDDGLGHADRLCPDPSKRMRRVEEHE